jgi:hypothetical protein
MSLPRERNTKPIKQRRDEARAYMKDKPVIDIMVYVITRCGSISFPDCKAELERNRIAAGIEREDMYLDSAWKEAKVLSELFKITVHTIGLVHPKEVKIGRPVADYSGQRVGALFVEEPTGYVTSTPGMDSVLWFCSCDCDENVVMSTQDLKRNLPYCGRGHDCGNGDGYATARKWRKDKHKPKRTHSAAEAADFIMDNLTNTTKH